MIFSKTFAGNTLTDYESVWISWHRWRSCYFWWFLEQPCVPALIFPVGRIVRASFQSVVCFFFLESVCTADSCLMIFDRLLMSIRRVLVDLAWFSICQSVIFFVFFVFIVLRFGHFLHTGCICTYTLTSCAAPTRCARVQVLAIGRRLHKASQQCWGCHCWPGAAQLK